MPLLKKILEKALEMVFDRALSTVAPGPWKIIKGLFWLLFGTSIAYLSFEAPVNSIGSYIVSFVLLAVAGLFIFASLENMGLFFDITTIPKLRHLQWERFLSLWIVCSVMVSWSIYFSFQKVQDEDFIMALLLPIGLVYGTGQWLVLRSFIRPIYSWVAFTMIGYFFGGWLFLLFINSNWFFLFITSKVSAWLTPIKIYLLITGIFVGVFQWKVLREKRIVNAYFWIISSVISKYFDVIFTEKSQSVQFILFHWVLVSAVSGVSLWWLLKKTVSKREIVWSNT